MMKYNIKHYWYNKDENIEKAKFHTQQMNNKFHDEINYSVSNTKLFTDDNVLKANNSSTKPKMIVEDMASTEAVFKYNTDNSCVLNFASYKNPGGRFINGSMAQEEALCHSSTLYNVLSDSRLSGYYEYNNAHKNRGLYEDRALYNPGIIFETDNGHSIAKCNVLTCAAPNRSVLEKGYNSFTEEENDKVMRSRVKFVRNIMNFINTDVAILGAWGCGVFAQDPKKIANYMVEEFSNSNISTVVFAVPSKGKSVDNYNAFKEAVDNYNKGE